MTMPPSGITGLMMNEDAVIDAEIQQQLELIDLENDDDIEDDDPIDLNENFNFDEDVDEGIDDAPLPEYIHQYYDMVQQQSNRLEEELKACDEVLNYSNRLDSRAAPLADVLLQEEAKMRGIDVLEFQKQILADIEKDEDFELFPDDDCNIDANDVNALVLVDEHMKMKKDLLNQLKQIEDTHKQNKLRWIQENESRKIMEEKLLGEEEEKRQTVRLDLQRQENELNKLKQEIQNKLEKEYEEQQEEMEIKSKHFQVEMSELTQRLESEKEELNKRRQTKEEKQKHQQTMSAILLQKTYRGYRVRKVYGETIKNQREVRKEKQMNERIKEVENQKKEEELAVKKLAEEKHQIEEKIKHQEQEKQKQEKEKQRIEEERKKAELKRKEDEEKREEQRKIDEKKKQEALMKEKERKQKLEEEKSKLEEEKSKLEEEKRQQLEDERRQLEEQKKKEEEEKKKEEEKLKLEKERKMEEQLENERKQKQDKENKILEEENLKEEQRKAEEKKNKDAQEEKRKAEEDEKRKIAEEKELKTERKKEESLRLEREKYNVLTQGLTESLEARRLVWIKDCLPWSKISNEPWKLKPENIKRPPRRPASAKKLPPLDDQIIIAAAQSKSLKQVTTVELRDLPGCNISTLGQCWGLQYLTLNKCNLLTIDGISQCKQLLYLDVQDNIIEYIDVKDLGKLQVVNFSCNKLSTIHGFDGCMNIRYLNLSHNKITRLGGLSPLRRLHTLLLNNNQLINTNGLSDLPTLQILDISHNHLQSIDAIQHYCLLQKLLASSNNIQNIPDLFNCVLLNELDLSDNNISSLSTLTSLWLPLLHTLKIQQNSITDLPNLENLFLLQTVNLSQNQILDAEYIHVSFSNCKQLNVFSLEGNPAFHDSINSKKLLEWFPRLCRLEQQDITPIDHSSYKCCSNIETMCCYQSKSCQDMFEQFQKQIKDLTSVGPRNQAKLCCSYFSFCNNSMETAVEYRYAHEYGDISIPSPPQEPKSSRQKSARIITISANPKDMFERAVQSSSVSASNPKDLFEKTVQSTTLTNSNNLFETTQIAKETTNPKDLFTKTLHNTNVTKLSDSKQLFEKDVMKSSINNSTECIQSINDNTKIWMAAIIIQSAWRGYTVRRDLIQDWRQSLKEHDDEYPEEWHTAATHIQAVWRGYYLRCRLYVALEYAQLEEGDDFDLPDIDMNEFNFDENHLDMDWRPADTPQFPQRHAVLGKPPSGKRNLPPIPSLDLEVSPPQPKHAWRNMDSPLSEIKGRQPRPPSSLNSTIITTHRSNAESYLSKKSEKLAEEWGFKDSRTAELMMQRAKKMKYNVQRKKKLGKLDPQQRLALFRKLDETAALNPVTPPVRKHLPRREYFQARVDEIQHQEQEKKMEHKTRTNRTYEWIHTQVGEHDLSSPTPRINQLKSKAGFGSMTNLARSDHDNKWRSMHSPDIVDLHHRRHSIGEQQNTYWGKPSVLPPIKTSSAPNCKLNEKMSWRRPDLEKSVGWGGGKKRSDRK